MVNSCPININEIDQITKNVHKKITDIYIPCLKTYDDILGQENDFTNSAEVFFEFSALHRSKGLELKQREEPVRTFRTSPIADVLISIGDKEWQKSQSSKTIEKIKFLLSSTEPQLFNSVMSPQFSVFEKAIILKQECGKLANIVIISNDTKIQEIKNGVEEQERTKFSDEDFKIMNTDEWLDEQFFTKNNEDVRGIVINKLREKKEMKIGGKILKLG